MDSSVEPPGVTRVITLRSRHVVLFATFAGIFIRWMSVR
jgi:hypothetical protein